MTREETIKDLLALKRGGVTENRDAAIDNAIYALRKYDALMDSWKNALEMSNSMMSCGDCAHREYGEAEGAYCGIGPKCDPTWRG